MLTASLKTTIRAKTETDAYTTSTVYTGTVNGEVPAFQGDVRFGADVMKGKTAMHVDFDLSQMGSTPRTMGNVVNYMNSQLKAAGIETRFAVGRTPGSARTVKVGDKTVNLSPSPDTFALQVKGNSVEKMTLTSTAATPAIFVAQASGTSLGLSPDLQQQLLKFDAGSDATAAQPGDGLTFQRALDANTSAVKAMTTAPDGSICYVLGTASGTIAGQTIQGASDLALMKYDAAGNLVFTRTLGAEAPPGAGARRIRRRFAGRGDRHGAGQARLQRQQSDSATTDTVVTVFDGSGQELWSQRAGAASADDQPASVAFGTDGTVYVAGQTSGAITDSGSRKGSSDSFIQAFTAAKKPLYSQRGRLRLHAENSVDDPVRHLGRGPQRRHGGVGDQPLCDGGGERPRCGAPLRHLLRQTGPDLHARPRRTAGR